MSGLWEKYRNYMDIHWLNYSIVIFFLIYLLSIANIVQWADTDFKESFKNANQLGDFLSGIFAPMAFLLAGFAFLKQNQSQKETEQFLEKQSLVLTEQLADLRKVAQSKISNFRISEDRLQVIQGNGINLFLCIKNLGIDYQINLIEVDYFNISYSDNTNPLPQHAIDWFNKGYAGYVRNLDSLPNPIPHFNFSIEMKFNFELPVFLKQFAKENQLNTIDFSWYFNALDATKEDYLLRMKLFFLKKCIFRIYYSHNQIAHAGVDDYVFVGNNFNDLQLKRLDKLKDDFKTHLIPI